MVHLSTLVTLISPLLVSVAAIEQSPLSPQSYKYLRTPSLLGYGTWNLDKSNATEAVSRAIQTGYKHLDCATAYGNQKLVGAGITDGLSKTGISRNSLWITSKLWNSHHDPRLVPEALEQTLSDLQIDYLDLWLMHWPVSSAPSSNETKIDYLATWTAMSLLLETRKVRFIGIANFSPAQLDELLSKTIVKPHVHQMELHPYLQQRDWIAYHTVRGIHVTAYSPLAGTNPTYHDPKKTLPTPLLENKTVNKIAKKRDCTPAQVALAWGIQRGTSVIPKSSHRDRIEENYATLKCAFKGEDIDALDGLGKTEYRYNNPSKGWGVSLFEKLEGL